MDNAVKAKKQKSLSCIRINSEIGTGPNYSTDSAKQGAPGFNEQYYLNENSSAKESVDAGTYETGLEHYLAEGKDAGLKSFAPFTKVHGYSGNDTIILREGDEIAFGMLAKILLKAALVTILLMVEKESIQLFIKMHPQLIL